MTKLWATAILGVCMAMGSGFAGKTVEAQPVVNPAGNPLLGTWVYSSGGIVAGACEKTRTFLAHTQTWIVNGKTVTAPATYAVEGKTVYVQVHTGSGGTVAYVVISKDEIMDTLGTGACHWKRQ